MSLKIKRRHGSPNWYVVGTISGKRIDQSTGTHDAKIAAQIRAKLEAELFQEAIYGKRSVATFAHAVNLYVEAGKSIRFLKPLVKHFGTTPLARIHQGRIEAAAQALYPGRSPATLNRQVFGPMSAVLKFAAKSNLCEPFIVHRRSEPTGVVRWLTPEEAKKLCDAAAPHLRVVLIFLFHTGARVGEALKLEWKNVDLVRGTVTFIGPTTKSRQTRTVPLTPQLQGELSRLSQREGPVLRTHHGLPYASKANSGGQLKSAFTKACRRAGIQNFRPHDTRHTWATWHFAENKNLIALMHLGGWEDEKSVLRYAHVDVDQFANTMRRLPTIGAAS